MTVSSPTASPSPVAPGRERMILWLLALVQFTVIMDFMIMMPLAPQMMEAFSISPGTVSGAVSVYAWCAGASGLLAMAYIDRYDRKRLLLVMFALFTLSNLACAMAPNFHVLVLSRAFAGLTGGVLGAISMAIISDMIPPERRGAATGVVMTSFSMAAVAGVPAGVVVGAHFGWAAAFYLLVACSVPVWFAVARVMPSIAGHLKAAPAPLSSTLPQLAAVFRVPAHLNAFALSCVNMATGMLIIPFISPVLVANYGVSNTEVSLVYLAGGATTLFTSRLVGRWTDCAGQHRVYRALSILWMAPALLLTHLPHWPLWALVLLFPGFMVALSGRSIPAQVLMTTVPPPQQRGAFLSANAAVQQLGTGLGAALGGLFLGTDAAGRITGFGANGWLAVALAALTAWWVGSVRAAPLARAA